MTEKKPSRKKEKTATVVAKPNVRHLILKSIGGSRSDCFNAMLGDQAMRAMSIENPEAAGQERLQKAAFGALAGIAPKDELEGMMAAQLFAAHNAAMDCYGRAMNRDQLLPAWRESLNQANKLSRTYVMLVDALNKHRGKGQQRVTVKHVHVNDGGQAVVGNVEGPGGGARRKS